MDKQIEEFITYWFNGMDNMEEFDYFIPYLDGNITIKELHETFYGIEGFKTWYGNLKEIIMPNNSHSISDLKINEVDKNIFNINFENTLKAKTFQSGIFNLKIKENWIILLKDNNIKIYEYTIVNIENLI